MWTPMQRMSQDSSRQSDGMKEHRAAEATYISNKIISGLHNWLRCQHFYRRKVNHWPLPWLKRCSIHIQIVRPKLTSLSFSLLKIRSGKTTASTVIAGVGSSSFPNMSHLNQSTMVLIALLRFLNGMSQHQSTQHNLWPRDKKIHKDSTSLHF